MGSVYLSDYVVNASFAIERMVPALAAGTSNWHDVQVLCTWYRQRAVCSLLSTGDPADFHLNMMQSAAAFLHFLDGCDDEVKVTSHVKPFLDALCGGYVGAARRIAKRSRNVWHAGAEYEDDFCYARFLMSLLQGSGQDLEQDAFVRLLSRFVAAAQGKENTRVDLCRALLAREAGDFDAALCAMLDARVDLVEAMRARGALSDELSAWMRHFAGEGAALLRIAEAIGMPMKGQYMHVPSAVRAASPFAFDPACWRQPEYRP